MSYILNATAVINNSNYQPWGYQSGDVPTSYPLKIAFLASSGLTKTWTVQDLDKTSTLVAPATSWRSALPDKPLYSPYRLKLYFDWHVAAKPL